MHRSGKVRQPETDVLTTEPRRQPERWCGRVRGQWAEGKRLLITGGERRCKFYQESTSIVHHHWQRTVLSATGFWRPPTWYLQCVTLYVPWTPWLQHFVTYTLGGVGVTCRRGLGRALRARVNIRQTKTMYPIFEIFISPYNDSNIYNNNAIIIR